MNKSIDINITADYTTLGELNEQTKNIWLVCHGYGQLSEYFIKNFECLKREENFVIAPQAFAKFYIGGSFSGRVGGSWMTKHNREAAINNYLNLLSGVFQQETKDVDIHQYNVNLLGFSQGTATITRWALKTDFHFDSLILWAGGFPHDVDHQLAAKQLASKDFRMVIGTEDQFFTEKRINEHLQHLREHGLKPEVTIFEGEHKIYDEVLLDLKY